MALRNHNRTLEIYAHAAEPLRVHCATVTISMKQNEMRVFRERFLSFYFSFLNGI